jgi:malonyl CoA-acyl carrier protein transacylase
VGGLAPETNEGETAAAAAVAAAEVTRSAVQQQSVGHGTVVRSLWRLQHRNQQQQQQQQQQVCLCSGHYNVQAEQDYRRSRKQQQRQAAAVPAMVTVQLLLHRTQHLAVGCLLLHLTHLLLQRTSSSTLSGLEK